MTDEAEGEDGSKAGDESVVEAETDVISESESGERTWEPQPVPDVTPETEAFWSGAAAGRLLLRECPDCGLVYYYPRSLCPDCFSDAVTWRESTGSGTVYSHSVARQVSGWPDEALPLIVAYVELDDGPRMLTNVVDCDPGEIEVGVSVRVRFVPTANPEVAIPVFEPVGD